MSVVIVAAHPDDEAIGLATALLDLTGPLTVAHITDGAPRSGGDAQRAGCSGWKEYAARRREEVRVAMERLGAGDARLLCLECPDQQASRSIAKNARKLVEILKEFAPSLIFTHAYEGGHPDHDATAAAVHAALQLSRLRCTLLEFAGYHAGANGFECECFLSGKTEACLRPLNEAQRRRKRTVLDCYTSQQHVLAQFPLRHEPLRMAPQYDFSLRPHAGKLYYENFDWGVDGRAWCEQAGAAFRDLGIPCVC
jgi:N-acetylglucosamine malate deacetylase 2